MKKAICLLLTILICSPVWATPFSWGSNYQGGEPEGSSGPAESITSGTAPTVDAAGEIAIDTTDDQLVYYGGAKRVIPYKFTECKTVESPVDGDNNVLLYQNPAAFTVTNVSCNSNGTSPSVAVVLGDGTNSFESITCDDDGATDDGSITNATFTANEPVEANFAAPSGTVTWCMVCISGTIDAS